ncbi:SMP-30/gluconolactonase/LRE family protein [Algibacter sp. 2305UL17-15]|uniref:SMP-30/gluconolactonase/LRE family protein n=1 Tax=Algibacter sp. 2305UL17-15 TaxID=3231268 RepID=UPI00345A6425
MRCFLVLVGIAFFACNSNHKTENPNSVLFVVDDLGRTDLSFYGSELYQTPNVDRLVENGTKLTNATCTARYSSRSSLMSGKYPTHGFIEQLDPALEKIISTDAKIEVLATGFNWSEGPVWLAEEEKIIFSDVPENKIFQWREKDGLSLYMMPSGYTGKAPKSGGIGSNGLTLDLNGNLILCQQGDRVISKLVSLKDSISPKFEQIVTNYNGKKFNSPNDAVFDRNGNMYFTDPSFGLGKEKSDIGFNGVYFFSKNGNLLLVNKTIDKPNGIAVSNDGTILYVSDSNSERPSIWAFDIISEGKVKNKRRLFDATKALHKSIDKQKADGMKLDSKGNIFFAGPGGVLIINPNGKHLGTIRLDKPTGNCEFANNGKTLFITCDDYLLRVDLK